MIKYSEAFKKERASINFEDSEQYAYITHFLQNMGTQYSSSYSERAIEGILQHDGLRNKLLNGNLLNGEAGKDAFNNLSLDLKFDVPFPPPKNHEFTYIDLFAGIGGFRLALRSLGGKCIFSSEIDKYSKQVYEANFGEIPFGDIKYFTNDNINDAKLNQLIPDHDILTGGFPCQAFSIAGKRGGFEDTRGTLFFDVARIIKAKKPKAFILENVKGLRNHRSGKTLNTILNVLREELNYYVPKPQILNAKKFGVPQNRERILIVGFRKDMGINNFTYPKNQIINSVFTTGSKFSEVKESEEVSVKYYLSNTYLDTLREHRKRHERKGNGFGFEIIEDDETANAIVVGGMGRERNLVWDHRLTNFKPVTNIKGKVNKEGLRRMTPREWARLQGFPDKYKIDTVSDTQAYKQFGNSVAVPVIEAVSQKVKEKIFINA
jgi:DNA (cytosine-5)-methyltransferase 1